MKYILVTIEAKIPIDLNSNLECLHCDGILCYDHSGYMRCHRCKDMIKVESV